MPQLPWYFKFAFLVCWPAAVLPADVYRVTGENGKDVVRITLRDGACVDKAVLEYLHEHILDDRRFKKAELLWEGEDFGACYLEKDGQVFTIGSDKKPIQPPLPRGFFKDEAI